MRQFSTAVKTAQSTWERVALVVVEARPHWSFDESLKTRGKSRKREKLQRAFEEL